MELKTWEYLYFMQRTNSFIFQKECLPNVDFKSVARECMDRVLLYTGVVEIEYNRNIVFIAAGVEMARKKMKLAVRWQKAGVFDL